MSAVPHMRDASFVAPARAKYGNRKTEAFGHTFASLKGARRYGDPRLMERAGEISKLALQPRFDLIVNGAKVCAYVGDFAYLTRDGRYVVEDVKSPITRKNPTYRLKVKLLKACLGHEVVEI